MKERGITQYDLYTCYGIRRSLLDKLRHNLNIEFTLLTTSDLFFTVTSEILWNISRMKMKIFLNKKSFLPMKNMLILLLLAFRQ